jgi:hypothetical protein
MHVCTWHACVYLACMCVPGMHVCTWHAVEVVHAACVAEADRPVEEGRHKLEAQGADGARTQANQQSAAGGLQDKAVRHTAQYKFKKSCRGRGVNVQHRAMQYRFRSNIESNNHAAAQHSTHRCSTPQKKAKAAYSVKTQKKGCTCMHAYRTMLCSEALAESTPGQVGALTHTLHTLVLVPSHIPLSDHIYPSKAVQLSCAGLVYRSHSYHTHTASRPPPSLEHADRHTWPRRCRQQLLFLTMRSVQAAPIATPPARVEFWTCTMFSLPPTCTHAGYMQPAQVGKAA